VPSCILHLFPFGIKQEAIQPSRCQPSHPSLLKQEPLRLFTQGILFLSNLPLPLYRTRFLNRSEVIEVLQNPLTPLPFPLSILLLHTSPTEQHPPVPLLRWTFSNCLRQSILSLHHIHTEQRKRNSYITRWKRYRCIANFRLRVQETSSFSSFVFQYSTNFVLTGLDAVITIPGSLHAHLAPPPREFPSMTP
jgi:hypothetical protein